MSKITATAILALTLLCVAYITTSSRPLAPQSASIHVPNSASLLIAQRDQDTTETPQQLNLADKAVNCTSDNELALYRTFNSQDWRGLQAWQRDRGLSATQLQPDGSLTQEAPPYLMIDLASLRALAKQNDADALYWLAIRYQQSTVQLVREDDRDEDKAIVIPRLIEQAALLGHAPAMQMMAQRFLQQLGPNKTDRDHPDLAIQARAWQWLVAWRLDLIPAANSGLQRDNELQALRLSEQFIANITQRRAALNLPSIDHQLPRAIALLKQFHQRCADVGQIKV